MSAKPPIDHHLDDAVHPMQPAPTPENLEEAVRQRTAALEAEIVARQAAEELLRRQRDLAAALSSVSELKAGLNLCLDEVMAIPGIEVGAIFLMDHDAGGLRLSAVRPVALAELSSQVTSLAPDSAQARIIRAGIPAYIRLTETDLPERSELARLGLRALGLIPIRRGDRLIGSLNVGSGSRDDIPAASRATLEAIAVEIAGAVARLHAREEQRALAERLRFLFDHVPISLWELDFSDLKAYAEGLPVSQGSQRAALSLEDFVRLVRVVDVNDQTARLFGMPDRTAVLRESGRLLNRIGEHREAILANLASGQTLWTHEFCATSASGRTRWFFAEVLVAPGHEATWDRVLLCLTDISPLRRAEQALQERDERLRFIFKNVPVGLALADEDGRLTVVNAAMCEMLGYAQEEMVGRHGREFLAESDGLSAAAEQGAGALDSTCAVRRKDGSVFHARLTARVTESGGLSRWLAAVRDVSRFRADRERLRTQAMELKRTNRLVTALSRVAMQIGALRRPEDVVNALRDELHALGWHSVLVTLDSGGECGLLQYPGLPPERQAPLRSLLGMDASSREAVPPPWGDGVDMREPAYHASIAEAMELYLPGVDPSQREELASLAHPRTDVSCPMVRLPLISGEHLLGVTFIWGQDLRPSDQDALLALSQQVAIALEQASLRREAAEAQALRDVDYLRSQFLANVSHEIRSPLGLIKLSADTLLRPEVRLAREQRQTLLETIRHEADALHAIVNNLLDLSRIDHANVTLRTHRADLSQLFCAACRSARLLWPDNVFDCRMSNEPLMVAVDAARIEQVLRNLFDNAVKYSPLGSRVTVGVTRQEEFALISVGDEGIGLLPEDQERVFERFYRADNSVTRRTRGAGIGLSLCREIVSLHDGRIWVESEPGRGTTVFFTLPLVAGEPEPSLDSGTLAGPPQEPTEPRQ